MKPDQVSPEGVPFYLRANISQGQLMVLRREVAKLHVLLALVEELVKQVRQIADLPPEIQLLLDQWDEKMEGLHGRKADCGSDGTTLTNL